MALVTTATDTGLMFSMFSAMASADKRDQAEKEKAFQSMAKAMEEMAKSFAALSQENATLKKELVLANAKHDTADLIHKAQLKALQEEIQAVRNETALKLSLLEKDFERQFEAFKQNVADFEKDLRGHQHMDSAGKHTGGPVWNPRWCPVRLRGGNVGNTHTYDAIPLRCQDLKTKEDGKESR